MKNTLTINQRDPPAGIITTDSNTAFSIEGDYKN
jgi:hypothetical protein